MEEVIIIGAGPAGLSVAYQLNRLGIGYRVLEEKSSVASSWRRRHPQLRLNTMRFFSGQPGWPIPHRYGRWVSRDDYIHYLEEYTSRFGLRIDFETCVTAIDREPDGWRIETSRGTISTRNVVVCTGINRVRIMPEIPGLDSFQGIVRHSEEFGSADDYLDRAVLIIGGGNSAFDIGNHLCGRRLKELVMSIRTPPSVMPKEKFGIPSHGLGALARSLPLRVQDRTLKVLSRLSLGDLRSIGIGPTPEGGYTRHARDGVTIAIDDGFLDAVARGRARIVDEIIRIDERSASTRSGEELRPDIILCATGYRPGLEPLVGHLGALDSFGFPHHSGAEADPRNPGLWFVGIRGYIWGNMNEQRRQSRHLAAAIAVSLKR